MPELGRFLVVTEVVQRCLMGDRRTMLSAKAVIEGIHDTWIQHERANTPARVLALCSDGVRWIPPDGSEIAGKTAISEWLLKDPMTILQLETSEREIWATGRLASLRASFQTRGVDAAGAAHVFDGHRQWVLEADPDGEWRVLLVSWVIGEMAPPDVPC